jgi:hypothetical protein
MYVRGYLQGSENGRVVTIEQHTAGFKDNNWSSHILRPSLQSHITDKEIKGQTCPNSCPLLLNKV